MGDEHGSLQRAAYQRWGIVLEERGGELHGPCPHCGEGDDRFIVWLEGNYFCRVCHRRGWVEDGSARVVTAADLTEAKQAKRERQFQKLSQWQAGYNVGYLEGYHSRMDEEQREYWLHEGITPRNIDRYMLGYVPQRRFMGRNKTVFKSDAYVIPHADPCSGQIVNAQYRINHLPPNAGGKYRQEPDLPPASFYTLRQPRGGRAIVVEGAKKGIVLGQLIQDALQLVCWPGATPAEHLLTELEAYETLWLILDPGPGRDAAVARAIKALGHRIRIIELPVKPDDAVRQHGWDAEGLREVMRTARRA